MTQILRLTINWTNFTGGPGYTNLHYKDPGATDVNQAAIDEAITTVDSYLDDWPLLLPDGVSFVVDPAVEILNVENGSLEDVASGSPDTTRVGTSVGKYAGGSGACISWYTNVVRNSRRIRGRTFMVPLGWDSLSADGTIDNATLAGMQGATSVFISNVGPAKLHVWSRPSAPGASDGVAAEVQSFRINDKLAQLRSRRD